MCVKWNETFYSTFFTFPKVKRYDETADARKKRNFTRPKEFKTFSWTNSQLNANCSYGSLAGTKISLPLPTSLRDRNLGKKAGQLKLTKGRKNGKLQDVQNK